MPNQPGSQLHVVVRPPGAAPYAVSLDRLTGLVRAYRVLRMGRLADKLARAANAVAGVEIAVERDVEKLIARTEEVHKRREAAFMRHHVNLDAQVSDLAEFEKDLEAFGKNDFSGGGETTEPPATEKRPLPDDGDAYGGTRG